MKIDDPVLAVIPARYASSRFPGKPLVTIAGKPMIQHVWERVRQAPSISQVLIATDDERIQQAALGFGAEVCLTSPDHPSGTDRLWEVAQNLPAYEWILNVQGDEPLIDPAHLEAVLDARTRLSSYRPDILTLVTPLHSLQEWHNPNLVKAVLTPVRNEEPPEGSAEPLYRALYFSRASVPYHRDNAAIQAGQAALPPNQAFRHLGLYLYRRAALQRFVSLPVSPLEALEKLEQLRALEAGLSLYAAAVSHAPIGIDTPEDLTHLQEFLEKRLPAI
jgi:3-deoxy-manno-octulosonate cytidylyltransferase (CMP-KDO synthetase)